MTAEEAFKEVTKVRAKAYVYIFDEMEKEFGKKKAEEVFSRAIYKMGSEKSKSYSDEAKRSPKKLGEEFVADPIGRAVFDKSIIEETPNSVKLEMKNCPLVEMWKEMGLSEERIEKMCDVADQIDYGKIEGLGYKLDFLSRIACGDKSCILNIKK